MWSFNFYHLVTWTSSFIFESTLSAPGKLGFLSSDALLWAKLLMLWCLLFGTSFDWRSWNLPTKLGLVLSDYENDCRTVKKLIGLAWKRLLNASWDGIIIFRHPSLVSYFVFHQPPNTYHWNVKSFWGGFFPNQTFKSGEFAVIHLRNGWLHTWPSRLFNLMNSSLI